MIIEPKLKEIIFGTLLGNSKLQTFTGGKTWRICFYQSLIHKEFLFHLFDFDFYHSCIGKPMIILNNSLFINLEIIKRKKKWQ